MNTAGTLAAIWIYPTKSLAAVALGEAHIGENGLAGDRERALIVRSGHARDGKTYRGKENNRLHLTHDARQAVALAALDGATVTVEHDAAARFFDARPVSVLFDIWVTEVARALQADLDPRRWRPNLYAIADPAFGLRESDLDGAAFEVGETVLRVVKPIARCVTTTYDIQTGERDPRVLRYVAQERDNIMGVYCEVERAGVVREGDALRLRARATSRTTSSSAST